MNHGKKYKDGIRAAHCCPEISTLTSREAGDYGAALASLSVRAQNVLHIQRVDNFSAFMALTPKQLLKFHNCGKKTLAEIVDLQHRLSSRRSPALPPPTVAPFSFADAPAMIFDGICGTLSSRAKRILEKQSIDNLQCFMALPDELLRKWQNCGTKTASEILRVQADIAAFARAQCCPDGVFNPAKLVEAPCLAAFKGEAGLAPPRRELYPDPDNPALWLASWVQELASSGRYARAFMLRMGMLGSAPLTLESVARQSGGVTRERVRQIQVSVERKAENRYQQFRLRPLAEATARVVNEKGGRIALDELTQKVLGRGRNGGQLKYATGLMTFFTGLQIWKDAGLELDENDVVLLMRA